MKQFKKLKFNFFKLSYSPALFILVRGWRFKSSKSWGIEIRFMRYGLTAFYGMNSDLEQTQ